MATFRLETLVRAAIAAGGALWLAAACAPPQPARPGVEEGVRPRARGLGPTVRDTTRPATATAGLHRKQITEKEAPATLLAGDGTRCDVSADRFASRRVGDRVWCVWRLAGGDR